MFFGRLERGIYPASMLSAKETRVVLSDRYAVSRGSGVNAALLDCRCKITAWPYFACSTTQFTSFTSACMTWSGFWTSLKTEL